GHRSYTRRYQSPVSLLLGRLGWLHPLLGELGDVQGEFGDSFGVGTEALEDRQAGDVEMIALLMLRAARKGATFAAARGQVSGCAMRRGMERHAAWE
ncbi:MAG: hypothetical protein V2A79_18655, partial [Planctomycetota bacterium]